MKPWIEKYRPQRIDDIIMESHTKTMIKNMIKENKFSNLIFYGPQVKKQGLFSCQNIRKYNCKKSYIHLNASHDRGVNV